MIKLALLSILLAGSIALYSEYYWKGWIMGRILHWTRGIRPRRRSTRNFIYAWLDPRDRRYIKIGRTNKPAYRLSSQQTSLPYPITVIAVIPVVDAVAAERFIRQEFSALRVNFGGGTEFYRNRRPLRLFLKTMGSTPPAKLL